MDSSFVAIKYFTLRYQLKHVLKLYIHMTDFELNDVCCVHYTPW